MKKKILHLCSACSVVILSLLFNENGYSQGIDLFGKKPSSAFIGFTISPSQTSIENSFANNSNFTAYNLRSLKKNSLSASLDAGYRFSKYFEFASGIGFSSLSSEFLLDSCKNNYNAVDSDLENYERRITGKNVAETQKITFLSIPVSFRFNLPLNERLGVFLQTGINFSIPVSKTYSDNGTFTYTGYYPDYNLLLYDITYGGNSFEGFQSNQSVNKGGALKIKSFNPEFISSAGLQVTINEKMRLSLGAFYNKLLTNISGYNSSTTFKFSDSSSEVNSIMGRSSKTTAQSIGIKISFAYFLK